MTAVRATFSDFRTVKSRKVAQLIMEIPIEQANDALRALGGVPQFASEQWVGIAPLTEESAPHPATSQEIWDVAQAEIKRKEMTRAQWAGMLCQDSGFRTFLAEIYHGGDIAEVSLGAAGDYVRAICGVDSRSMLDGDTGAAAKWDALRTEYDAWRGRIARPRE